MPFLDIIFLIRNIVLFFNLRTFLLRGYNKRAYRHINAKNNLNENKEKMSSTKVSIYELRVIKSTYIT